MSELLAEITLHQGTVLSLRHGDMTQEVVDAIVNAANTHLQHGGGLAGAIVRQGGREIQRESDRIGFTATGTAAVTGAGSLPARAVIHAVGPVWSHHEPEDADRLLASATEAALEIAAARGFRSIALPALSAGIYGFPRDRCAGIMLDAVKCFVRDNPDASLEDIRFVLLDEEAIDAFLDAWEGE